MRSDELWATRYFHGFAFGNRLAGRQLAFGLIMAMAMNVLLRSRLLLLLLLFLGFVGDQTVRAATLLVYTLNDSGLGSLRQAIQDNATLGGGNNVVFSNTVVGTITLSSGELAITNNLTIAGPGANVVTVNGNNAGRIFDITGSNVRISGLSLVGAGLTDASVRVFPGASLILGSCTVASNACAGIYSEGALVVTNSTLAFNTNNSAFGGGIANWGGAATVTNCTFSANSSRAGGGIYSSSLALLSVNNSTIVSNLAAVGALPARIGGGIANFSTGLPVGTNRVFIRDTIVAGNATASAGQGPDVDGGFTSGGYNLIGQGDASTGLTNGLNHDLVGSTAAPTNALVGPLQNNGGSTPTMALLPGSPAIDQGINNGLTVDQRGQTRDFDFPNIPNAGDGTDIGAFEASTFYSITLNSATLSRAWAISNSPAQSGFLLSAAVTVQAVTNTAVLFNVQLVDAASGTPVPLQTTQAVVNVSAGGTALATNLSLVPRTQLDSVDKTFAITLTLAHASGGPAVNDLTNTIGPVQLFHFNGRLLFGTLLTYFTNVEVTPVISNVIPNDHLDCSLAVSLNAGYLPSGTGHTYGDGLSGVLIPVSLFVNGDATLRAGASVNLHGPSPDIECIQNICFQRTNTVLTATGAVSTVILSLPIGFSIGPSVTNRLTTGNALFASVSLDGSLRPAGGALAASGQFYAVEETLPCWFAANSFNWLVNLGQLQLNVTGGEFVRKQEDDLLTSSQAVLVEPNAANRISNDGYFRNAVPNPGLLLVAADVNGVARITTANGLSLQPPELRPHFPYTASAPGNQIPTGTGLLTISNNLPTSNSHLNLTGPVAVSYGRDCTLPGCTAGQAGPATLSFSPAGGQLSFTPDGGLFAYGSVPSDDLKWGFASGTSFAQVAGTVSTGALCIAGIFLLADQTSVDISQRAAVTLFSGFGDASNPAYLERPGQPAYNNGFANYPGLNFRSPSQGSSYVGQQNIGPYPLNPASKYYVRFGGVNGTHMAAAPPPPIPLYGYNFTFSSFGFSYLDGRNQESRTDGAVTFPAEPAGFVQEFDRMKVTCRGDLTSAQIPAATGSKHLTYWNINFSPQSLDFRPTGNDACGTSPRFLVLAVETTLPFIPQALHAVLGFWPNGNLVTPADGVDGVDSRFQVPGQLSLQGPGTSMFSLSTASEGYFNNWLTPGAAALPIGFYNLAGKLRVPFFSDIKVHLQVTSAGGTDSHVDIMGGWPAADSTQADLGWSVNASNYFNTAKFDPTSDGWPVAQNVLLGDYVHAATPDGKYHPRAERDWIEVAKFDYPLVWNPTLRRFSGFAVPKVILPVIDVYSRLKELAPGKVDFDFVQDFNLQLPRIKVLDLVNDALNGNSGPLLSVSNVVREQLQTALDTTGLNELSHLLREDAQSFFNPILNTAIDTALSDTVMAQLAGIPQANAAAFLQSAYSTLTSGTALQTAISGINGTTADAYKVTGAINQTLTDVEATAGLLSRILDKDSNGNRHVVEEIVKKLVQDQGPGLGFIVSVGDAELNPLLAELEPTLAEIQSDLQDASNQVAQVQTTLQAANGDFSQALSGALLDAGGMSDFVKSAASNVTNYLASVLTPAGDLFTNNPAAVQQAIRQQIAMAFLASALPANYQKTFRQFLYDKDFLLDQLMDTLFDQINLTIRNALSASIGTTQDSLFQNMKGAGLLGQSLLSAKIRGAPTFNGDSLRKIHLDAAIKMNLPDEMNFNAYMDIKELDSQSAPLSCIPAGAPSAEVTLGAKDVKLDWPGVTPSDGKPLTLSLEARWTLQRGAVLGIGGLLDIKGEAGFEGCTVKDIGASLAIGETENYFAAKAAGTVVVLFIPVDLQAGIFVGHSCSLDPLRFVDPEAEQVLGDPAGFSGVYVQYGGGLSLSEILFGSSSCLLDIEASINTSEFYQGGPRLGKFGGRQKSALDASLLCVLSGHAEWSEFMSVDTSTDPANITLGGSAEICGSIGKCPFCLSKCAGITVKGVLSTGGINYFVDY